MAIETFGSYHYIPNEKPLALEVKKESLSAGEPPEIQEKIAQKVAAIESNPKAFNGKKAVLALPDGDTQNAELYPSDYATFATYLGPDKFNRGFFPVGVAVAVTTSDGQMVVGNREKARKKAEKEGQPCPYQTPCGFVDVETGTKKSDGTDETIFDILKKNPSKLMDVLTQNAKRETEEELIPLSLIGEENAKFELLGFITSSQKWKEGETTRNVGVVKTVVFGLQLEKTTAEQLKDARTKAIEDGKVKDALTEMPDIAFVSPEELGNILTHLRKGNFPAVVKGTDEEDHKMIAEHSVVLAAEAIRREKSVSQPLAPETRAELQKPSAVEPTPKNTSQPRIR